jgi:hypothetical protein
VAQRGRVAAAGGSHGPPPLRAAAARRACAGRDGRAPARAGPSIDSALDHGGTVAIYLRDPDGNGIELSYDRPRSEWFDDDGDFILKAEPFDPSELLYALRA